MPAYEDLLAYLRRSPDVLYSRAVGMLDYNSKQTAYKAIERLIDKGVLERFYRDNKTYLKLKVEPIIIPPKPTHLIENQIDYGLDRSAGIVRYILLYGSQHFDSRDRLLFMQMISRWMRTMRPHLQFLNILDGIVRDGASKEQFDEAVKDLLKEGWLKEEYETYEKVEGVVNMLGRVNGKPRDFLGIDEETWMHIILSGRDKLKLIDESSELS
jgi:hypothetical protein